MDTTTVVGRFINRQNLPVEGHISFRPQRLWVEHEGLTYPTLTFNAPLVYGAFCAVLTPTLPYDDGVEWQYTCVSPVGQWHITIPASKDDVLLSSLLPTRFRI